MPGDSGIFATCNKGREAKCVGELRDLFAEYAEQLYGDGDSEDEGDKGTASIENDIQAELAGIQKPPKAQLFVPVKLDVQCGEYPTTFTFSYSLGFAYCGRREEAKERGLTRFDLQLCSSKPSLRSSQSVSCTRSARMPWRTRCTRGRGRRSGSRL